MSQYGLGVELTSSVVRWATATTVTTVAAATEMSPSVAIVDGRPVAGAAAAAAMSASAGNVVSDLVDQFVIDRLWFIAGAMLAPDEALAALLSGCVNDARHELGASPGAVTISCPANWDEAAIRRLRMIVDSLGLALPAARTSISAHSAAADAAGRLPQQADQAVVADDLPPLPAPSIRRAVERSAEPLPPTNTVTKKRRRGLVVWLIVILGIPAIVVLAIRLGSEPQDDAAPTSDASDASDSSDSSDAADTSATFEEGASSSTLGLPVPPVLSALTLGLISNGDVALQEAVRTEVAALTADETTFPSGVFLVVQTVGSDTAALLDQLRGQGVNAVISDVTGPAVNDVVSAANAAGVALCLIGASAEVDTVTGPGVAVGTSKSCVDLIGLAAVASDSPDRIRILDAMTQLVAGDGLPCATVAQCGAYLRAEQPITFEPVGELIRLAPDA